MDELINTIEEDMLFLAKVQNQAKLGHDVKVKVTSYLGEYIKNCGHMEVF